MENNKKMTNSEIAKYLLQSLNMSLSINNETSYINSFDVEITKDGFLFIPSMPTSFIINDELYQKIYMIANAALFPRYTLLKQNSLYLISRESVSINTERALFFPWVEGTAKRLIIEDFDEYIKTVPESTIPLMADLSIDINKITSILISGSSGSGKSTFTEYLLYNLKRYSEITVIDLKFDSPSRFAHTNKIRYLAPSPESSKNDFVAQVNEVLSDHLKLIHERQKVLFTNPSANFKHYFIVIEEILALTSNINKAIKESFFSLINEIALLGRSASVNLLIISQRFSTEALPIVAREQANVLIQLGNINSKTTQFLFPDLNPEGIVVSNEIGAGLIQILDNYHHSNVFPFLAPTIKRKSDNK